MCGMPDDETVRPPARPDPHREQEESHVAMLLSAHGSMVRGWRTGTIATDTAASLLDKLEAHLRAAGVAPPPRPAALERVRDDSV
jgi:hypothetical protein